MFVSFSSKYEECQLQANAIIYMKQLLILFYQHATCQISLLLYSDMAFALRFATQYFNQPLMLIQVSRQLLSSWSN